jgi:hypothetical protein
MQSSVFKVVSKFSVAVLISLSLPYQIKAERSRLFYKLHTSLAHKISNVQRQDDPTNGRLKCAAILGATGAIAGGVAGGLISAATHPYAISVGMGIGLKLGIFGGWIFGKASDQNHGNAIRNFGINTLGNGSEIFEALDSLPEWFSHEMGDSKAWENVLNDQPISHVSTQQMFFLKELVQRVAEELNEPVDKPQQYALIARRIGTSSALSRLFENLDSEANFWQDIADQILKSAFSWKSGPLPIIPKAYKDIILDAFILKLGGRTSTEDKKPFSLE